MAQMLKLAQAGTKLPLKWAPTVIQMEQHLMEEAGTKQRHLTVRMALIAAEIVLVTSVSETSSRKQRFNQYLKKGYGLEKIRAQRQEVLTMLKLSDNINDFKTLYEKRFRPLDGQHTMFTDFFK